MKAMKRWICCLLAGIMVFALGACRQQAGVSSQSPETENAGSTAETKQMESAQPEASEPTTENAEGKTLVVYYSASGNTGSVAGYIAAALDADTFEITPVEPYTSEDLNWTDDNSRVSREHNDASLRSVELTAETVEHWEDYDTVLIGYPIWWGIAAWPVDGFVSANDFTGKTVIPFCTSASSGMGESGELLAELAGTGDWQEGQRFRSGASEADVTDWIDTLGIAQ